MKAILPILICSAISATLGYYFGHITVPANSEISTATSVPTVAPQHASYEVEQPTPVAPALVAPAIATPITTPAPVVTTTPISAESAYAERATLTIQTLTDTQGRTIQASILKVTEQDVNIRTSDGLETKIPLSMLSPEDIAFCNYLREQAKEDETTAPVKTDGFDWDAYFNS